MARKSSDCTVDDELDIIQDDVESSSLDGGTARKYTNTYFIPTTLSSPESLGHDNIFNCGDMLKEELCSVLVGPHSATPVSHQKSSLNCFSENK
jgi:hypothetical protein